jgi:hypothetical protein
MDILSLSPFPTAAVAWCAADGRAALTVVCKATYALAPGVSRLAEVQEPIHEHDTHWDDDPEKSVVAPGDLAPFKPRADVVLVGNAYAPEKTPVRSLVARLAVGEVDKTVEVFCQRLFSPDGEIRAGALWTRMALRWERAAGGPDTWNPVGISSDAPADKFGQRSLPNLQRPGVHITRPSDILAPTGFGPLAQRWLVRRERLGHYQDRWSDEAWAQIPLGDDFDWLFFQAAPPDQQTDALRADVRLVLENLHPDHPRFVTDLPGVAPRAFVDVPGHPPWDLPLTADTLWIDTARSICTLTWRGQLALSQPDAPGRVVVALEQPGQTPTWAEIATLLAAREARPATVVPALRPGVQAPAPRVDDGEPTLRKVPLTGDVTRTALHEMPFAAKPFRGSSLGEVTISAVMSVPAHALPFQRLTPGGISVAAVAAGPVTRPALGGPRRTVEMRGVAPAVLPAWLAASASTAPVHEVLASPRPPTNEVLAAPLLATVVAPPALVTHAGARMPVGAPDARDLARAAYIGAAEASDAAAERFAGGSSVRDHRATPSGDSPAVKAAPKEPPAATAPAIELLWFDASEGNRLRSNPSWAKFLSPRQPAKKSSSVLGLSFGAGADAEPPGMTRADVLRIFTQMTPMTGEEARKAMTEAYGPGGGSTAPFLLLQGELELRFDEDLELRMVIEVASPLAANDKKLKELLDAADDALRTRALRSTDVLEGFITRLREAWGRANRHLSADYLAAQTERVLLNQRSYQLRSVLDASCIRSLLVSVEMGGKMPVYLPQSAAGKLPLFSRFPARVLAEGHPQQDQYEAHPVALRAIALGRVLSPTWKPGGDAPPQRASRPG